MAKGRWIQVRITPEQEARVKELASEAGVNVSDYVRGRVLEEASVVLERPKRTDEQQECGLVSAPAPPRGLDALRRLG